MISKKLYWSGILMVAMVWLPVTIFYAVEIWHGSNEAIPFLVVNIIAGIMAFLYFKSEWKNVEK